MKKTLWILLCLLLLTGCGDAAADTAQEDQDLVTSKYAYQAKYLNFDVDASGQFQGVDQCCIRDTSVFFMGTCLTGGTEIAVDEATGEPLIDEETGAPWEVKTVETALYRLDLETRETVRLDYHPAEPPEGMLCTSYVTGMFAGLDGTFWILENQNTYSYDLPEDFNAETGEAARYYVPGENRTVLSQYGADGQLLKSVDVSEREGVNSSQILFDAAGNIYINTNVMISLLDAQGNFMSEFPNATYAPLCQISDSEIGAIVYDAVNNVYCFQEISPEPGGFGEKIPLFAGLGKLYPGGEDYRYLYEDSSGVFYGFGEESRQWEKLFSWLDCDVDRSVISGVSFLENGNLAAITKETTQTVNGEWIEETVSYGLIYLNRVDPSELPQRQELTLACMGLDSNIQSAILAFNRSHGSVRIAVRDYSVYNTSENTDAGLTRLNTEILSGKAPDILCTNGLPVDQYAARGYLTDLWPLIDGDETLGRDDLMTHLFDVMSIDGRLYQITSFFSIWTAVGDAGVLGDRTGWTMEELLELLETMPDNTSVFGVSSTKSEVLALCVNRNLRDFIHWEDQTCSFESPEFLEILNFANSFPAEYAGDTSETVYERFATGKQLLFEAAVLDFSRMQWLSALVGGDPCYVGYPSSSGNGSVFYPFGGMAITTACQNTDAAWSFLRTFLTEEYQTAYSAGLAASGFPTNRRVFEASLEKKGRVGSYTAGGVTVRYEPASEQDYDTFMRLYESCGSVYTENETVYSIISAEAAPFFDGLKTAEEAAALIQDRVSLYVQEQK